MSFHYHLGRRPVWRGSSCRRVRPVLNRHWKKTRQRVWGSRFQDFTRISANDGFSNCGFLLGTPCTTAKCSPCLDKLCSNMYDKLTLERVPVIKTWKRQRNTYLIRGRLLRPPMNYLWISFTSFVFCVQKCLAGALVSCQLWLPSNTNRVRA